MSKAVKQKINKYMNIKNWVAVFNHNLYINNYVFISNRNP